MAVRYDQSIPEFLKIISGCLGSDSLEHAVIVRDAIGKLSVIVDAKLSKKKIDDLSKRARKILGGYVREDRVVGDKSDFSASIILEEAESLPLLQFGSFRAKVLDRRIVGADWLSPPVQLAGGIPRFVFSSLKGGVGRSTALCVAAAHLSRKGYRVLAVDLDLEAPGIGTMLLDEKELPQFGVLDYLVENGISGIDKRFLADAVGDSYLGSEGARVSVIPAIGTATIENPADALGKISRAYIEDVLDTGGSVSFSGQVQELLRSFEKTGAYDAILIDTRAGLHETTATGILGLGGNVLLFGINQPQTYLGYRLLLAHLARFPVNYENDWRDRLRFVHAKASGSASERVQAEREFHALYGLLSHSASSEAEGEVLTSKDFDLGWRESSELIDLEEFDPPSVLFTLDDSNYRNFDPLLDRAILSASSSAGTFKNLLQFIDELLPEL